MLKIRKHKIHTQITLLLRNDVPFHFTLSVLTCVFRRIRKIAKRDNQLPHSRLSVRMEQLGSQWTDFDET